MLRHPVVIICARAINLLFFVATAAYCVLNYSSFAYYQFIRPGLIGWLPSAVAFHHVGYWVVMIPTLLTLLPDLRRRRWIAWSYAIPCVAAGAWLVGNPLLATVDFSERSLRFALVALLPPVWLAVVDHALAGRPKWARVFDERRALVATAAAAAIVVATYAVALPVRLGQVVGAGLTGVPLVAGFAVAAAVQLVAMTLVYLVLLCTASLARLMRIRDADYWLVAAVCTVCLTAVLHDVVCAAISLTGVASWVTSLGFSGALALTWSGVAWRSAVRLPAESIDAMDVWVAPIAPSRASLPLAATLAALPLVAFALTSAVIRLDWNFLLQKLGVLLVWSLALGLAYAASGRFVWRRPRRPLMAAYGPPVGVLILFAAMVSLGARVAASTGNPRLDPEFLLDRYAAVDPSFRLLHDLARANPGEAAEFYRYLKGNSTIARREIAPIDVDFVQPLTLTSGRRPHIFLLMVDSLRRDYLSPYNHAVGFTPALAALAADSYVFDRAFTRYGATGLSVPSIWAGGMLIHKQYVRPFHSMNALEKLLDADRYRRYVSRDHIVDQLMQRSPSTVDLDVHIKEMDYTLCRTLGELQGHLEKRDAAGGPVFAMTRSLDLHMANLARTNAPRGETYPGFADNYAAQVRRVDQCVGAFVDFLKRVDLYDESVIVLTSDHGESLGEEGRWGHAYTLFPEVIRIPLIVHLPPRLAAVLTTDLTRVAFSTDITPTLYALLGHEPADLGTLYGAPLFVARDSHLRPRRRDSFLLSSSYGAVYGMLRHNGRQLFIANAIEGRDAQFDLSGEGPGKRIAIGAGDRALNWELIRAQIAEIAAQYHFSSEQ